MTRLPVCVPIGNGRLIKERRNLCRLFDLGLWCIRGTDRRLLWRAMSSPFANSPLFLPQFENDSRTRAILDVTMYPFGQRWVLAKIPIADFLWGPAHHLFV
jgi:hypothetical protein